MSTKRFKEDQSEDAIIDIVFPKNEFEYDYSAEQLSVVNPSGPRIRELFASKPKLQTAPVEATPEPATIENEDEDMKPMTIDSATSDATASKKPIRLSAPPPSQNFSLHALPSVDYVSANPLVHLHNEIINYRNFVAPSKAEMEARFNVLNKVRQVAQSLWPQSKTEVFGSFATGLCLPESDVDISIFFAPRNAIHQLSREFSTQRLVDSMEVIAKAKVPIIKLKLKQSKYTCDICFGQAGGLQTAQLIKRLCEELPEAKCLVLVIKHFLAQRGLNNTYQGGMGSYLCFLTCIALVQRTRRLFPGEVQNLGFLLCEYLNFYGNVLDLDQVGISLLEGGSFYKKRDRTWFDGERSSGLLSMEDPINVENDVGRNTRGMGMIKRAFSLAYRELKNKLEHFKSGDTKTMILNSVIRIQAKNHHVTEFSDDE